MMDSYMTFLLHRSIKLMAKPQLNEKGPNKKDGF